MGLLAARYHPPLATALHDRGLRSQTYDRLIRLISGLHGNARDAGSLFHAREKHTTFATVCEPHRYLMGWLPINSHLLAGLSRNMQF